MIGARKGACAVRSAATAGIFLYYKVAELAGPSTILIHCMRCLAHGQLSSIQAWWKHIGTIGKSHNFTFDRSEIWINVQIQLDIFL